MLRGMSIPFLGAAASDLRWRAYRSDGIFQAVEEIASVQRSWSAFLLYGVRNAFGMRFDQLRRPRKNVDVAFLFATPAPPSHSRGSR